MLDGHRAIDAADQPHPGRGAFREKGATLRSATGQHEALPEEILERERHLFEKDGHKVVFENRGRRARRNGQGGHAGRHFNLVEKRGAVSPARVKQSASLRGTCAAAVGYRERFGLRNNVRKI